MFKAVGDGSVFQSALSDGTTIKKATNSGELEQGNQGYSSQVSPDTKVVYLEVSEPPNIRIGFLRNLDRDQTILGKLTALNRNAS